MSNNYHTPITRGAAANASTFNTPDGQLDQAISNIIAGTQALEKLNQGSDSTVTIASGVITISKGYHEVANEGGAASDDLDTINGGTEGQFLLIQVPSGKTVVLKHNTGNIKLSDAVNRTIAGNNLMVMLFYNGSYWVDDYRAAAAVGGGNLIDALFTSVNPTFLTIGFPARTVRTSGMGVSTNRPYVDVAPGWAARTKRAIVPENTTVAYIGNSGRFATASGTNVSDANGNWVTCTTNASSGASAGCSICHSSTNAFLLRPHNPKYSAYIVPKSSAVLSYMMGFFSDNNGAFSAGQHVAAFKYTNGDTNWKCLTGNGTSITTADSGVAFAVDTPIKFEIWIDSTGGHIYFAINGTQVADATATLPGTSTALYAMTLTTTAENVAKTFWFGRLAVDHD